MIFSVYEPLLKHDLRPSSARHSGVCSVMPQMLSGDRGTAEDLFGMLHSISKLPDVLDLHSNAITFVWCTAEVYWNNLLELAMVFRHYAIGQF